MKIDKNKKQAGVKKKSEQKIISPVREILEKNPPEVIQKIKAIIQKALVDTFPAVKIDQNAVKIEHPKVNNYGDFSTNIGMIMAGRLKMKPIEAAEKLSRKIEEYIREHLIISYIGDGVDNEKRNFLVSDILENIQFVLPGFINLNLSKVWLISQMIRVLEKDEIVKSGKTTNTEAISTLQGLKVMVEFTDPNPFKELHIGHLYSNSVGESLSRLFEDFGAEVKRANYFGDVGMHVAKSIWGLQKNFKEKRLTIEELEKRNLRERVKFLGESYALGSIAFEEDEQVKEQMKVINYLVFLSAQKYMAEKFNWQPQTDYGKYVTADQAASEEIASLFRTGRDWSLSYFETIYKILGTKFDFYYPESIVGEYGAKYVRDALKKGIFAESDGAVVFEGEKYGLHTRVFINKLGLPTYEAKELGLAPTKYKDFQYDFSLIVTGKEIDEYFKVLLKALSLINNNLAIKTRHLGHGMVRLPQGKMSSRTGEIVTGESLIEEVKNKVKEKLNSGKDKYSKEEYDEIAEKAAVAAIKYSFLKVGLPADLIFDLEKSVSFEGDSGPYLMYTYARAKSVLRKAQIQGQPLRTLSYQPLQGLPLQTEELEILKSFYQFDEVVWEAARNLAPNLIATFLYSLSQKFNLFYHKHSILDTENSEEIRNFRLVLTEATANILKKGLYLLGIETVERM